MPERGPGACVHRALGSGKRLASAAIQGDQKPLAESRSEEMSLNARAAARHRPSRLQLALAAIWLMASLGIGGIVGAQSSPDTAGTAPSISRTGQP